jgi:hypothetical protein
MPLRLLVRAAPFLLGAVAAAVWLRRRRPERPALPVRTGPAALPAPEVPADRAEPAPAGRFERTRVDIVTIVDDLLGAAR